MIPWSATQIWGLSCPLRSASCERVNPGNSSVLRFRVSIYKIFFCARKRFEYFGRKSSIIMQSKYFLIGLAFVLACSSKEKVDYASLPDEKLKQVAVSLAQTYILADGHVDLPYRLKVKKFRLEREYMGIPVSTTEGDFDFERAKKGGLDAPFMSIYIPSSYQLQADMGKALADSLIDMIDGIVTAHPDKFGKGTTPQEIEENTKAGKISLPLGMENGAPIGNDLANVKYFYDRGIRYVTLTHGKDNQICDSSYDSLNTWKGLSPFGEQVVKEMNRVGVMVDISHVSDSTFYDVIKLTKIPVIASHSSCRFFTPGFQRNMSDDMLKALKENGGVIQINFGSTFLDSTVAKQNTENRKKLQA